MFDTKILNTIEKVKKKVNQRSTKLKFNVI
jgi:hypothetical protein